jgi:hypothetical protein
MNKTSSFLIRRTDAEAVLHLVLNAHNFQEDGQPLYHLVSQSLMQDPAPSSLFHHGYPSALLLFYS